MLVSETFVKHLTRHTKLHLQCQVGTQGLVDTLLIYQPGCDVQIGQEKLKLSTPLLEHVKRRVRLSAFYKQHHRYVSLKQNTTVLFNIALVIT